MAGTRGLISHLKLINKQLFMFSLLRFSQVNLSAKLSQMFDYELVPDFDDGYDEVVVP